MRSSSSTGAISIAASAQKIDVDNRISLRYYYRIADNLLKQAAIYRQEKNIIDLYVILLRFSSLVTETIPMHREYHVSHPRERTTFKKKLLYVLNELEMLKPDVQRLIEEMNAKSRSQVSRWDPNGTQNTSLEWPPVTKQSVAKYEMKQVPPVRQESQGLYSYGAPISRNGSSKLKLNQDQFRKHSLSIPRATEETLSRHSILGPNGLYGQWQPPRVDRGVQYPSNLDLSSIEIPCLEPQNKAEPALVQEVRGSEVKKSDLESVLSLNDDVSSLKIDQPCSIGNQDNKEAPDKLDIIRQPSPPPVLADIQDLIPATSPQVSQTISGSDNGLQDELIRSKGPLELHISTTMMDTFMRLAKSNTQRNLETCGVLAGSLKNRKFHITALIIPKQDSTSDSCQTTNEEEIFEYQDKESLFPLGWIHTHPTQSCFMSSIDVHTHYSYQIMLPESIAIVMAPRDPSRKHGIFRLTSPGGMSVIRHCDRRGFHPHEPPADGGPIYAKCSDVYMNPNLKFDVVDFR